MPYYRHNKQKIVYHLLDNPIVTKVTHKGQHAGWKITGELYITDASGFDPSSGKLTKPSYRVVTCPLEGHYREEKVLKEFFLRAVPQDSTEIEKGEFEVLRKEFSPSTA